MIARIVYAVLVGVVTFIVLLILGIFVTKVDVNAGNIIKEMAPLIGMLVGVLYFFVKPYPPQPLI
jgi:hypothetical protein